MSIEIYGGGLSLSLDPLRGHWVSLRGGKTEVSWISGDDTGLPFVAGSSTEPGQPIAVPMQALGDAVTGASGRGGFRMRITSDKRAITARLNLAHRRGPRSGLRLDLDHLDREWHLSNPSTGVMPVTIETAPDLSWAWLAWQRNEDDLLLIAINGPSSGWHIRYSYHGHRMEGFDLLGCADDVIANGWPDGRLPSTEQVVVHLAHAKNRESARRQAADLLGLAMAVPAATCVVRGGQASLDTLGLVSTSTIRAPDGSVQSFSQVPPKLPLTQEGIWVFQTTSRSGRTHESRILALGDWRNEAEKAMAFHRTHYQLKCGAFARALNPDLKPEGRTLGGSHFGDPDEPGSCRTGEFGGFGAWAQLIHQKYFGAQEHMEASVAAYFDWITNRGREHDPRPGTICRTRQFSHGRSYGPGHLFEELYYAQHEAWLIHQLADAIGAGDLTQMSNLQLLVHHYLNEHVDDSGAILNQNKPDESPVDYSTVDCALTHLLAAESVLRDRDSALADRLAAVCRKQAEHLCTRGFEFPTEGEPCTEDGSIACQAWGLAHAYNYLPDPEPAWIELAEQLIQFHRKLELDAADVRLDGSTLRFWETQYESDDWGPSINAGHGWTLWAACARWELYRATGRFAHMLQAWRHTTCVASRLQRDGSFPPCWTPDPIPALGHHDTWSPDPEISAEGRQTSVLAGMRYPSCFSMSGMFLFITAPQMWYRTCGFNPTDQTLVNATLREGVLTPHGPLPCTEVSLGAPLREPLRLSGLSESCIVADHHGRRRAYRTHRGALELSSDLTSASHASC